MREYVITTDNMADLPEDYLHKHQIDCSYLSYTLNNVLYTYENFLPVEEFYDQMRKGSLPTTSQAGPQEAKELIEPHLKKGEDVLHIAFSSGLSGTYNSCCVAVEELKEEYPDRKILVVDSLCASLGQGLLVYEAVKRKEQGASMEEVAQWVEQHKLNLVHLFTVENLNHLWRGGRVSRTTAIVGDLLNIKPILHVDDEGHLTATGKVRGRKKSLLTLVDNMEKQIGSYRDQCHTIFISHGDCLEDAKFLERHVRERFPVETVIINHVGVVIGSHSGPGTLALFFLGDQR